MLKKEIKKIWQCELCGSCFDQEIIATKCLDSHLDVMSAEPKAYAKGSDVPNYISVKLSDGSTYKYVMVAREE